MCRVAYIGTGALMHTAVARSAFFNIFLSVASVKKDELLVCTELCFLAQEPCGPAFECTFRQEFSRRCAYLALQITGWQKENRQKPSVRT